MTDTFAEILERVGNQIKDPKERAMFLSTVKHGFNNYATTVFEGMKGLEGEDEQAELREAFDAEMKAVSDKTFRGGFVPLHAQQPIRTKYKKMGLKEVSY